MLQKYADTLPYKAMERPAVALDEIVRVCRPGGALSDFGRSLTYKAPEN